MTHCLVSSLRTATLAVAAAVLALPLAAPAQEKRSDSLLTVEHYLELQAVSDPQISPDGSRIVYTRRWVNAIDDRFDTELWVVNADGTQNRRLGKGGGARWSPDGTRIAYVAEGEPRGPQVFVRWMNAEGATSQITRTDQAPADLRWSPDGRWVGFSAVVPKQSPWRVDLPEAPKGAKWTGAPRIVQSLHYRQDRRGFTDPGFRHLFVVAADGGPARQVTRGDWSVGARFDALDGPVGWDWTPDGKTLVFEGLADSTGDMNYRVSHIYAVDLATSKPRQLTTERGMWGRPVVSPDGRRIAYTGTARVNDSYHARAVYVMDANGGNVRDLTSAMDRDPSGVDWSSDGRTLYFAADDHGTRNVYAVPAAGGTPRALTTGDQLVALTSLARNGIAAGTRSSYYEPGDVVRLDLRRPAASVTPVTRVNAALLGRMRLGQVERIRYTSTGGAVIDGWIVKPPGFDSTRKYPLVFEIHGGPHGAYNATFSYQFQNFAANNFVVLYTNPRGSTGYGSAFGNAIMRDYPGVDYQDLMAGVNTVVQRGFVDTTAMYVGGCSGGGVLSSWVIGHTNRFAAAAVRCPVINWMSMAGQTDVPLFTYGFFARPFWEDPKPWLEHSSLMYVGNVTTPTVVMTGELDRRTPIPQSEEYFSALRMRGIPAALLRFEGEYHGTGSRPSNFMRTQLYMMSWYRKWRRTPGGAAVEQRDSTRRVADG